MGGCCVTFPPQESRTSCRGWTSQRGALAPLLQDGQVRTRGIAWCMPLSVCVCYPIPPPCMNLSWGRWRGRETIDSDGWVDLWESGKGKAYCGSFMVELKKSVARENMWPALTPLLSKVELYVIVFWLCFRAHISWQGNLLWKKMNLRLKCDSLE